VFLAGQAGSRSNECKMLSDCQYNSDSEQRTNVGRKKKPQSCLEKINNFCLLSFTNAVAEMRLIYLRNNISVAQCLLHLRNIIAPTKSPDNRK
jgi:hypothetical protein